MHFKTIFIAFLSALLFAGCSTLAKKSDTGVIISRRASIRSSIAVVAADLVEVSRGDAVDILDSDTAENGERWLRVRAHDPDGTEGWIEARNVMPHAVLERSQRLAEEDKDIPGQATGQLRASTNLRLTPDRSNNDNVMMKLGSGARFEIVEWKRVPPPKSGGATESDDVPKNGNAPQPGAREKREPEPPKEPEETTELWYKVRLSPDVAPAPAGWLFGKQVELTVPGDIIVYRTGREFVAWRRLDEDTTAKNGGSSGGRASREDPRDASGPGSWVILEKSSSEEPPKAGDPDFDRIFVLGYDRNRKEHYTAYRGPDLRGFLPLRVVDRNGNKVIIVRVEDQDGQLMDAEYQVRKDDQGILKVTALNEPAKSRKRTR